MDLDAICIAMRVIISCIVFAGFVFTALKSRFKYNSLKTGLMVSLLIAITAFITVLFLTSGKFFYEYYAVGILIWLLSAMLILYFSIKGSYFEILFIVLVVLNLYVNIVTIAKILATVLSLTSPAARALMVVGVLIVHIPLLWILILRQYKQVVEFNINFSFWKFIWIIPALTYLIFYVKLINDYWRNIINEGTGDIVFSILWSCTTYLFFLITLQMLIQAYKGISAREQAKLVTSLLKMRESQYEKMLEDIERSARSRHDLRYHLLSINGFVTNGDLPGLQAYVEDLSTCYLTDEDVSVCQNHVADVILRHFAAMAKDQETTVSIKADIRKDISISDIDLCIIFGNLVGNAVDACVNQKEGERIIKIKAETRGNHLTAVVENSYSNEVIVHNGVYHSTKHEGDALGLLSVKKVVEKYNGILNIDYDRLVFRASVFVNERK